jgi:hypothetical protein
VAHRNEKHREALQRSEPELEWVWEEAKEVFGYRLRKGKNLASYFLKCLEKGFYALLCFFVPMHLEGLFLQEV